jgi:hypothetical protein
MASALGLAAMIALPVLAASAGERASVSVTPPSPRASTSEHSLSEAEHFLQRHAPNRFKAYNARVAVKNSGPLIRAALAKRYGQLRNLQAQDSDLYNLRVQQMENEDQIFGLHLRLARAGKRSGTENLDGLKTQLRQHIRQGVRLRVQEIQHRIVKLQQLLKEQQNKLKNLQNEDRIVENRLRRELQPNTESPDDGIDAAPASAPAVQPSAADSGIAHATVAHPSAQTRP